MNVILLNIKIFLRKLFTSELNTRLAKYASGTLVIRILNILISFGLQILLVRVMGSEQYGIYMYVVSWLGILSIISTMGFPVCMLRFVSAYRVKKEWNLLRGIIIRSTQMVLAISTLVGLILISIVWKLRIALGQDLTWTFIIAAGMLPFMSLLNLHQKSLQALKRVVLGQVSWSILRPGCLSGLVLITGLFSLSTSSPFIMGLTLVATLVALSTCLVWVRNNLPHQYKTHTPAYETKRWITTAIPLAMVLGFHFINIRCDILMIGALLGTNQVGIYTIASRIAELITFTSMAINQGIAPMISELYTQEKKTELQNLIKIGAWGSFLICVPVTLGFILFGQEALSIFGEDFERGYTPLIILSIGSMLNSLNVGGGYLLTMTGHEKQANVFIGFTSFVNIVLNRMLIPSFGITGAALATVSAMILWNMSLFLFVQKRMHLNPTIFQWNAKEKTTIRDNDE